MSQHVVEEATETGEFAPVRERVGGGGGGGASGDQPAKTGSRPILQRMGEPIVFDSGKSTLKYVYAGRDVDLEYQVCKGVGPVISVAAAPVIIPAGRPTPEAMAADRSVDIFGLTSD